MITGIPHHIPAIPMLRILRQYCDHHDLPFRLNRPEEIIRAFEHYSITVKLLN